MLKSILSESALNSADLDDGISYLFNLLEGNIIDIEQKGCPVSDYYDSGKHTQMVRALCIITTDADKVYSLYFELWTEQEIEPNRLGIDKIQLYDHNERVNDPNYIRPIEFERSGIYNPNWDIEYYASLEGSEN